MRSAMENTRSLSWKTASPSSATVEVGLQDIIYAVVKSGLEAGEIVTTGIVETQ